MNRHLFWAFLPLLFAPAMFAGGPRDLMSDTWTATDALGRHLPTADEVGLPRPDKFVGIFYFDWHGAHGYDEPGLPTFGSGGGVWPKNATRHNQSPFDLTEILSGRQAWGEAGGVFYHWGQPELGYYVSDDPYVIRRHAQLLTEAGIDVMILDVTNSFTYHDVYLKICKVLQEMRDEGNPTPQIAFIANANAPGVAQQLFDDFYGKNLYPQLWFRWKGKPLLLAPPQGLSPKIADFFTIRECWAWSDPGLWFKDGHDKWTWLDHSPQRAGWHENKNKPEEISVTVAGHPTDGANIGRSYHDGKQPPLDRLDLTPDTSKGLYFAEQWKRALQVDPEFIFITGWNEWVAQRSICTKDDSASMCGRPLKKGESAFVDEYNEEYSRDIEPMAGGHTDNYYYQMVANIRRFKGARPLPSSGPPTSIQIGGDFSQWDKVEPEYLSPIGKTAHRDHMGWGRIPKYVDDTGRNDIICSRVGRDEKNIYFYARTTAPLSPSTDPYWMLLFIDSDADPSTGWQGYDFLINAKVIDGTHTTIMRAERDVANSWRWEMVGNAPMHVNGNQLELAVPCAMLQLPSDKPIKLDFHWEDNIQKLGDITEFFLYGTGAPDRRFNYRYECPQ